MRRYTGKVWADRWEAAGRKHDQRWHQRCVKAGLADPDEPINRDGVGDAFDTIPRDPDRLNPGTFHPHDEGDYRSNTNADFGADDIRRYGEWSKTQLPPEQHDEIDAWVRQANSHGHMWRQVSDVQEDRDKWLSGKHINHPKNLAEWSQLRDRLEQVRQGNHRLWEDLVDVKTMEKINERVLAKAKQRGISDDPNSPERQDYMKAEGEAIGIKTLYLQRHYPDDWRKRLWDWATSDLEPVAPTTDQQPDNQATPAVPNRQTAEVIPINRNNRIFNREDTVMTATNTDTEGGLETAIAWAEATAKDATDMVTIVEEAESNLSDGGVKGETLTLMSEISETYETLAEQTTKLVEKLREQQQVAEAYEAVADAGTRDFVTS